MRKGQEKVLQKAECLNLSNDERKILENEKYNVVFYNKIYRYICNLRKNNIVQSYEDMVDFVDMIYNKIPQNIWYLFIDKVLDEEKEVLFWLLENYKDLLFRNSYFICLLMLQKDIDIKEFIKTIPKSINILSFADIFTNLLFEFKHPQDVKKLKEYAIELSKMAFKNYGEEYSILKKASVCIKNNLDISIAKEYDYDYWHYLFIKYKDIRSLFYDFYPSDAKDSHFRTMSVDLKISRKEDEAKIEKLKKLEICGELEMDAYELSYEYTPKGLNIKLLYYNKIYIENNLIYSSNIIYDQLELFFSFTTEYPVGFYIKKRNKWVPVSAKDLTSFLAKDYYNKEIINLFNCIENIFLKYNCFFIKDVMKYIRSGRFIPPLTINDIYNYANFNQLFKDKYPCPKNWNKHDINALYCAYKLRKYIAPSQQNLIFEIIDTDLLNDANICNVSFRRKNKTEDILKKIIAKYYSLKKIGLYNNDIYDYVNMCCLLGEGIKLKITSRMKFIEEHNRMASMCNYSLKSSKKNILLVPKKSKFNELQKLLPKNEFEWIKRIKRLDLESTMQHNCVWSYSSKIKDDKCAIYHFLYQPEKTAYTIEFVLDKKGNYQIKQMQKACNEGHSIEAFNYVEQFINKYQNINQKSTA